MKEYYSRADYKKAPKYDAHTHYHTHNDLFVRQAKKANLRLISINTDFDILSIDKQFEICHSLHQLHPQTFDFLATFDASAFASKTFAYDSITYIKKCMAAGARGVKIWKNAGMTLKNEDGQFLMADDPVFAPIFEFLEKEKIPLLAHLGEPRNCWLPLEEITIASDRKYYSNNPNYHMYQHPEAPSYDRQIRARDNILERYPELVFVGAHLGSMEWSLEEVAKRLDRFPNFHVDISGRFAHIIEQTIRNRSAVIDFFETYQNRIIYGVDYFVAQNYSRQLINLLCKYLPGIYMNLVFLYINRTIKKHWLFFATGEPIKTGKIINQSDSPDCVKGLKLTKDVVHRIFYENTRSIYYNQR